MIRWLASAFVCALLLGGYAAAADPGGPQVQLTEADKAAAWTKVLQASQDSKAGAYQAAADMARSVIGSPVFETLTKAQRHDAYLVLGVSLSALHQNPQAHEALVAATILDGTQYLEWWWRLTSADAQDHQEILNCIGVLAEYWPDQIDGLRDYIKQQLLVTRDEPALRDMRLQTLETLMAKSWPRDGYPGEFDRYRIELILAHLDRGDRPGAVAIAQALTSPRQLVILRIDRRFDALRPDLGARLNVAAADQAYLAAFNAYVAAHPGKLRPIRTQADALIHAGRPTRALALVDKALAEAKAAVNPQAAFSDYDAEINWLYNARSSALLDLGRTKAGLEALTEGASKAEQAAPNISQAINLAEKYDQFARPREALSAVASLPNDHVSAFGQMQAESVRACAYAELNDIAAYRTKLAFVRDHAKDAPATLQTVLLCANDLDGAAQVLVQRLQDPDLRSGALEDLQNYAHHHTEPPFQLVVRHRLKKVRDRPEVRAAINAVGRIEAEPLYP